MPKPGPRIIAAADSREAISAIAATMQSELGNLRNGPDAKRSFKFGPVTIRFDQRHDRQRILEQTSYACIADGPEFKIGHGSWDAATFLVGYLIGVGHLVIKETQAK